MPDLALELQPASFRGVPFHVDGSTFEAGRRVQVHEYPQRDKPYAEDLGRATRAIAVEAFVVGEDYIAQANALIGAAEEPGPGTLVHPWLGSMQVSLRDPARVRFDNALGRAVISLSFVEAGELAFPSADDSTQAASQAAADDLSAAAADSFADTFDVADLPSFVSDFAAADFLQSFDAAAVLGGSFSALSSWAGQLGGWAGEAVSLFGDVAALGAQVADWFDLSGIAAALAGTDLAAGPTYASAAIVVPQTAGIGALVLGIVGVAGNGGAGGPLNAPAVPTGLTPARTQQAANAAAVHQLVRCSLLAQAVGMSSVLDVTVQTDALAVRDALCRALDMESLVSADALYDALQAARRAVWADISARASQGARVIAIRPGEVLPALVLAYDQYEDAARGDEIAARNHVVHPGFMPAQTLQVLSR